MSRRWMAALAATFALILGTLGATQHGLAQDTASTPMAHDDMAADAGHPAHIHLGTCAELGDVVFPLDNLTGGEGEGHDHGESATPAAADAAMTMDLGASSETVVDASLDDIVAGGHALNVHESVENIQNYIACGDITGTPTDGELEIELLELNASGYTGTATLTDNGDGTTTVDVHVTGSGDATPEASPAS
jgi:hypothetical protein